jgi:hypothetical protein
MNGKLLVYGIGNYLDHPPLIDVRNTEVLSFFGFCPIYKIYVEL